MTPINLDEALQVLDGVRSEATRNGWRMAAAVVDSGGNIVAVVRMDEAPFGVVAVATDKAFTAAAFSAPTGSWAESTVPGASNWGFHTALGGRMSVLPGGTALLRDGTTIGAVGVSGSSGAADLQCAIAGARAAGFDA